MTTPLGSYRWSESSEGLLNPHEKRQLVAMLLRTQVHQLMQRWLYWLKPAAKRRLVDLDKLKAPDTAWAAEVNEYVHGQQSAVMTLHCLRTWAFGWVVGQAFKLQVDEEVLYSASMMHDLGLTKGCQPQLRQTAFQVVGARAAYEFSQSRGLSFAEQVYEAISLHLNPWLNHQQCGNETFLLKTGAHMDVIGAYHFWLSPTEQDTIHRRYPRRGFADEIKASMHTQPHHPCSHAGVLNALGFSSLVDNNPLNQYDKVSDARDATT
ncbi:hypothetical protein CHH28_19220 [Bacterioplanes sanyensis]|uniref:Uncharacterized protein n=1 Tax=Bacterioplanes sanyensis TaxID=1249553 RepID=A0A222FQ71_9GAMM|nr:HD domain-containing protein [Bacterioplanes sanyensis]ASP40666.1 hypothetical protein CHH28_19220 [Bacterioplanes sanyensis]